MTTIEFDTVEVLLQEAPLHPSAPGWSIAVFRNVNLKGQPVYLVRRGTNTASFGLRWSPVLFRSLDESKARAYANRLWVVERAALVEG